MGLLVVGLGALVLGALLVFLLALAGPRAGPPAAPAPAGWLAQVPAEELARVVAALLGQLGFAVESSHAAGDVVELRARNTAPLVGGRLWARVLARRTGEVGEEEVLAALELARAESWGKALLVTPGTFSAAARALAADGPLELVDGPGLWSLLRAHLPEVVAAAGVSGAN